MPSLDTVRIRTHRSSQTESPVRNKQGGKSSAFIVIAALAVGGFFLLTHPAQNQPSKTEATTNISAAAAPTVASNSNGIQISLPQPDTSKSLEETVILDAPLPDSQKQTQSIGPTTTTNSSVTTTSTAAVKPDSFMTRILNGSGNPGLAAKRQEELSKKGFSISKIGTAVNTYTKSIIYYTAGHEAEAKLVRNALANSSITLTENEIASPADVLYVVGANES